MAIKNEQFLKELQPYSKMTVVPGVTVGDLNFASAQSVWSTGYIAPTSNDNFAANSEVQLFQAAIGDNGQGLAPGQVMSRGQTNWQDSSGRLPANEVFIGIRCLVSVYEHTNAVVNVFGASFANTGALYSSQVPINDVASLYGILKSFSWEYQIGDGIVRNVGPLASYPQGGGVWEAPIQLAQQAVAGSNTAIGAQNGLPSPIVAKELPIPFMFLPNITSRVVVKCGSPLTTTTGTFTAAAAEQAGDFLAIRMTFQGYKLTMPV